MTTIFDSAAPVKSDRPFGPAVDDLDEFAAMFADDANEPEPDWDAIAAQRAWEDLYEAGLIASPEIDRCLLCGATSVDLTKQGLCDRCDDAATDASTASRNYAAGLGFQVF
jgi:hypothetical protein